MIRTIQQGSDYILSLKFKDINNNYITLNCKTWELIIFNPYYKGHILRVKHYNDKFENLGSVEATCKIDSVDQTKLTLYINGSSGDFAKGELSAYTIYHIYNESFKDGIQSIKSNKIKLGIWIV